MFAVQPGPIEIIWRKATPHGTQPSDHDDTDKWHQSVGNYYRLHKMRYVVSGSASKTPKKIYWNQAGYPGPQVSIPTTTIGALHIVYNRSVPEKVEEGIRAISLGVSSSGDKTITRFTNHAELRKWQLKALNAEGRVFVELLGDLREDGMFRVILDMRLLTCSSTPRRLQ